MKFGPVPIEEARGATAVHAIRKGDLVLKKGTGAPTGVPGSWTKGDDR